MYSQDPNTLSIINTVHLSQFTTAPHFDCESDLQKIRRLVCRNIRD